MQRPAHADDDDVDGALSGRAWRSLAEASRAFAEAGENVEALQQLLVSRAGSALGDSAILRLLTDDGLLYAIPALFHRDPEARAVLQELVDEHARCARPSHHRCLASDAEAGAASTWSFADAAEALAGTDPRLRALLERCAPLHLLQVPVRTADTFFGSLLISRTTDAPFDHADQRFAQQLADRCALSLVVAHRLEEKERERARLAAVLDGLPAGVAVIEPCTERVLSMNEAFHALFPEAVCDRIGGDSDRLCAAQVWPIARAFGAAATQAIHVAGKHGASVDVRARVRDIVDADGRTIARVAHYADVSEETHAQVELLQEALEATRVRDDFLTVAAHELRTPLTSLSLLVSGLVRALERGSLATLPPDRLRRADEQVQRLMRLVHQLVDVSRIASGRLHLDVEPVDLGRLAHTVVGRHRHTASSIECQLALGVTGNVDGTWDRRRLDHAISSVLESALRHGAGKRVVVAVSGTADGARLSVCEPRSSLQAERQWAAAVPHCRAEEGVPCTGGLSLGLWVAQHVVEAHGGALQLTEDDDSVGVVVDLPRTTPPSKSPAR